MVKSSVKPLVCIPCGSTIVNTFATKCQRCGGPLDVIYDTAAASLRRDSNMLNRWQDLLPISSPKLRDKFALTETPLIHAQQLGKEYGLNYLYLKDETRHPTRTTKDRMAAVAIPFLYEHGVREFVISSTGNSSSSMGRAVSKLNEMRVHIFCGQGFSNRIQVPNSENVMVYETDSDFIGASTLASNYAKMKGLPFEGGFFNVGRREGLKLSYLETVDQLRTRYGKQPDYFFQAISSGMGLLGAFKGMSEYHQMGLIDKIPALVGCQQSTCQPMVVAYQEGVDKIASRHIIKKPYGPAMAILRGDPSATYPYVKWVADKTHGSIEGVPLDDIYSAHDALRETEGIDACAASSVALASALNMRTRSRLRSDDVVVVNLTGADRPPTIPEQLQYIRHDSIVVDQSQPM